MPIAHGEGNYYAPPETIDETRARPAASSSGMRSASGAVTDAANPNGSVHNIAGICSERRNVVGLMPHPERACEAALGSRDGLVLFESVVAALADRGAVGVGS